MKRELESKMFFWIDDKLKSNGLAQEAAKNKDARLVFGLAMEACVGIVEKGGNNSGPMVELIQKTIGGAVREPWCMALVQTCIAYAEEKTKIISPIIASEHCMTVWRETPKKQRVKTSPLKYAVVIWNRTGTDSGHTGAVVEAFYPQWFRTVEGNTDGEGSREGDEVCYQKSNWLKRGSLQLVGFLKPFEVL